LIKAAAPIGSGGFFYPKFIPMDKTIRYLQKTIGERAILKQELDTLIHINDGVEINWFEYDEIEQAYYLTPEILAYEAKPKDDFEALGLGNLEERIVDVLEEGKNIKWSKVALGAWLFLLFIVVYTIIETVTK
tara:strand:+ start:1080 stop:1478 length:399 start_codon:yes stop_codon:yes gene_type:complete